MIMLKIVNNNEDHANLEGEYYIQPMFISYIVSRDIFFKYIFFEDILTKVNDMVYIAKQLC